MIRKKPIKILISVEYKKRVLKNNLFSRLYVKSNKRNFSNKI